MVLKSWRFAAVLLLASSMGLSFAHLMELVPRVFYFDAELWIGSTTRGLYYMFGTVGAVIEVCSIVAAFVLVYLVRGRGSSFRLTLAAAVLAALALGLWILFVAPVNAALATWTVDSYPADWTRYRDQWEFAHAANAVIKIVAFALLTLSLIVESPPTPEADEAYRGQANSSGPIAAPAGGAAGAFPPPPERLAGRPQICHNPPSGAD